MKLPRSSSRQPPSDPNQGQQQFLQEGSWDLLETHWRLSLTVTFYCIYSENLFIFIRSSIFTADEPLFVLVVVFIDLLHKLIKYMYTHYNFHLTVKA